MSTLEKCLNRENVNADRYKIVIEKIDNTKYTIGILSSKEYIKEFFENMMNNDFYKKEEVLKSYNFYKKLWALEDNQKSKNVFIPLYNKDKKQIMIETDKTDEDEIDELFITEYSGEHLYKIAGEDEKKYALYLSRQITTMPDLMSYMLSKTR